MDKGAKRFAIGAAVAAGIGYVAGVLTAPKSGKETRKDIQNAVSKARAEAEKQLKNLNTELNDLLTQAKSRGTKLTGAAKEQYNNAVAMAQKAKTKVRNLLSAVHEGDAEDDDLQKAIKEATSAIEHLKTYIKKDDSNEKEA
ncbi:MAG TPA: YtxH domain-containing protein [Candidatus Saccharimonadales bacterium]|nr:YtxH domain-containing protein [Candidatus Saccharimonadales bacterium]